MSSRSINQKFFLKPPLNKVKPTEKLTKIMNLWRLHLMESVPFVVACGVLVGVISLKSPVLLFCILVGSLITIITQRIGKKINLPKRKLIPLQIIAVATL
ncbi:MAG: hypothetical protein RMX68_018755, partial [Aulosira sp. ZfuVER01]|nr:hypothetical protein [Aulosira sp. ZfuCHP01]